MLNRLQPTIITDVDTATLRRFYVDTLGWEATIDLDGYVQFRHGADESAPEIAFSAPQNAGPLASFLGTFGGDGMLLSVPVADADAHHDAIVRAGVEPDLAPTDMPWGWRSYVVTDPTGLRLDFYHEVEAADG